VELVLNQEKNMKGKALDRAVGKIKLVLAQREMGEKDLAQAIGLTAHEVFQILTRERKLEFKTLEDIATALRISLEFFFKEQDGNEFANLAKESRLTEAENAILVERLSEMREALTELLIKKRQKSHDRDFRGWIEFMFVTFQRSRSPNSLPL
jgi:transcriptional regulator with XRE-family HTH domain